MINGFYRRSAYFFLFLPARPYLGLVDEAASLPIFSWCVHHGWHLPISGILIFSRCLVQQLGLSEKSRGIHSVIGGCTTTLCLCGVFGWFSKVIAIFTVKFRAICWGFFRPIFSEFYSIFDRLLISDCSSGGVLAEFLYLILTEWKGLWSSRKDCFTTASDAPWSLLSALCFCSYMTEKDFMGSCTFSTIGFIL